MDWTSIVVALVTALGGFLGVQFANRKNATLWQYRLEQLEDKVDRHNSILERVFKLEESNALHEAELKRLNKRMEIVEGDLK